MPLRGKGMDTDFLFTVIPAYAGMTVILRKQNPRPSVRGAKRRIRVHP
jgi:hypothetical protein